jgi:hypothetical protein
LLNVETLWIQGWATPVPPGKARSSISVDNRPAVAADLDEPARAAITASLMARGGRSA